jgi:hypothetical protein
MTREEVIRRLEQMEQEIIELKTALIEAWSKESTDSTQIFLDKCGGWEDTRTPEEIIEEIYSARTSSSRGATLFEKSP